MSLPPPRVLRASKPPRSPRTILARVGLGAATICYRWSHLTAQWAKGTTSRSDFPSVVWNFADLRGRAPLAPPLLLLGKDSSPTRTRLPTMSTVPALTPALSALEAAPNQEALRTLLRQCRVFRGLSEAELDATVACLQLGGGREGTVFGAQDGPGDGLYIVYSGRVKVVMYGANGREVTLAILRPGEVFGELSMLDGAPRS